MKLYRFCGSAEHWPGCGMCFIKPAVSTNLTQLKKAATQWIRKHNKAQIQYDVRIEALSLLAPTRQEWEFAFTTEILEDLVDTKTVLKRWKSPEKTDEFADRSQTT